MIGKKLWISLIFVDEKILQIEEIQQDVEQIARQLWENLRMAYKMEYSITIKLDTESIVKLLIKYSNDWLATLNFIELYAKSQGYTINRGDISKQMRQRLFGDTDEK